MAVKRGIAREAAVLYPFEETRKALYEGAKRAMAAIPKCKPYLLELPIKAKMQYLDPIPSIKQYLDTKSDTNLWKQKLLTKEGIIKDALHITDF